MRAPSPRSRRVAAGLAGLAALGGGMALTSHSVDFKVFVGATPTPPATSTPTSTSTPTATNTPTSTTTPSGATANVWVDLDGGTCTRQASPTGYSDGAACGSFSAATAAASAGDTIRVKSGTYGPQSCDGPSGGVTVIGEDGATIDSGSQHNNGLSFVDNCTVDNVDVGGDTPFVWMGDGTANTTWENSTLLEARGLRTCTHSDAEPILIQSADPAPTLSDVTLRNIDVQAQYGAAIGSSGCSSNKDNYHLEGIRIDQKVDGVLIDRVTFEGWPGPNQPANSVGYGSGHIFWDTLNTSFTPTDITVQNSRFKGPIGGSYQMQVNQNVRCVDWTFAYNTFEDSEPINLGCGTTGRSVTFVGNLGTRPQNCMAGVTFTKNVWEWASGTPCGTDARVNGTSFSTGALDLNSDLTLAAGSPAIDAGETPSASDYCTGLLGSVDRDGDPRPDGSACDAGADER